MYYYSFILSVLFWDGGVVMGGGSTFAKAMMDHVSAVRIAIKIPGSFWLSLLFFRSFLFCNHSKCFFMFFFVSYPFAMEMS